MMSFIREESFYFMESERGAPANYMLGLGRPLIGKELGRVPPLKDTDRVV